MLPVVPPLQTHTSTARHQTAASYVAAWRKNGSKLTQSVSYCLEQCVCHNELFLNRDIQNPKEAYAVVFRLVLVNEKPHTFCITCSLPIGVQYVDGFKRSGSFVCVNA